MKIAHLTVARALAAGHLKQLAFEIQASSEIEGVSWTTLALQSSQAGGGAIRRIPFLFRPLFLRNLYGWLVALRLSRDNDYLLMRHITFDPFAFIFAPFIRNRISVHHAKEIEELVLIAPGWKGRAASALERLSGRAAVQQALAVAGVTREIAEYECAIHSVAKPVCVYANGVDVERTEILQDLRRPDTVEACFLASAFSPWHGLDRLIQAIDDCEPAVLRGLRIHLIGNLTESQARDIRSTPDRRDVFQAHGLLAQDSYRAILDRCHVGIASLAMDRQNLTEGSTLKVREMLAMGLAVYSTHRDASIPRGEFYYKVDKRPCVRSLRGHADALALRPRWEVSKAADRYINKLDQMKAVTQFLIDVESRR